MGATRTGPVVHALDANHPVVGELVVAADLSAASEATARAGAEIIVRNDRYERVHLCYLGLAGTLPSTTDVAADVAAGPVVNHDGGRRRRLRLARSHIRRKSRTGHRSRGKHSERNFFHVDSPFAELAGTRCRGIGQQVL